jgi:hypothetical protein
MSDAKSRSAHATGITVSLCQANSGSIGHKKIL